MLLNQLKFTVRRLLGSPMISAINLTGLALGIACAYLGMAYAWQELSYERSFSDSDKIYRVGVDFMNMGGFAVGPEYLPEYLETRSHVVESYARVSVRGQISLEKNGRSVSSVLLGCDSSYFKLFDFPLLVGNKSSLLTDPSQVVISEKFALQWFGQEDVIGKNIEIPLGAEKKVFTVSGVVDNASIRSHMIGDIWIPINSFLQQETSWYSAAFYTYFKLHDIGDYPVFLSELENIRQNEIYENYAKSSGLSYKEWIGKADAYRFIVHPLQDIHLKSGLNFEMSAGGNLQKVKGFLFIGLLVLLVAIANYINLTTARSYTRVKEIGVKKSLGVNQSNLLRQFIGESLIESFGVLVLAIIIIKIILGLFSYWTGSNLLLDGAITFKSFGVFLLFTVGVGLLASVYPAFYLSSIKANTLLRNGIAGTDKNTFRSALVVFQFAITTWLICGSLVIFSQLKYLGDKDLGFDKDGLMVVQNMQKLGISAETYRQQLSANDLVVNSSFAHSLPGNSSIFQASFKTPEMDQSIPLRVLPVDADFIETMGIRLLEGNNFQRKMNRDSTVAIINESAKKALGIREAIGSEIAEGLRVIGVVSDFHIESLKQGIQPVVLEYNPGGDILALRLDAGQDATALSGLIQDADRLWSKLDAESALQFSFIDETFRKFAEQEQIESRGILALTIMALLIACLGLFGLSTFTMKKREKEISIRKILGSSVAGIVGLLSRDFLILVFISLSIAIPFAWYFMSKWLENFAYRIDLGWWVFGLAALIAIVIAFVTVGFQSIKAALLNPAKSLRND